VDEDKVLEQLLISVLFLFWAGSHMQGVRSGLGGELGNSWVLLISLTRLLVTTAST
jgi:hypothetical protein